MPQFCCRSSYNSKSADKETVRQTTGVAFAGENWILPEPPLHHPAEGVQKVTHFLSAQLSAALASFAADPTVSPVPGWQGSRLNVNLDHIANNDTLAWSLIAVLVITMALVTACGLGIYRQFRNITPEAELLETIKREAREAAKNPCSKESPARDIQTPISKPWERPGDWWKDQPGD